MAYWFLAFSLIAFPSLILSCGDGEEVVDPADLEARLSLSVVLPDQGALLVPVASLQVQLTRPGDSQPTVETTEAITVQRDTIEVTLTVPLEAESEEFNASATFRDADGATVFSGQIGSLLLESSTQTTQESSLPVDYVGTGSDAVGVEITSTDSVVAAGDSVTLTAAARDAADEIIPGTPIRWRSTEQTRASFIPETPGRLVAGPGTGSVEVVAELLTGPSDRASIRITPSTQGLLAEAIDSLEAALFLAVTEILEAPEVDFTKLDLFSFSAAKRLFEEALAGAPNNQTAAFGLAISTILSLEDDPGLRAAADSWESWLENNDEVGDLTRGGGPFPPTLEEQQDLLLNTVEPALVEGLELLDMVDDPEFTFTITARMQGRDPGAVEDRELDLTEVVGLRALLETTIAAIEIANAIESSPSPYGPVGFAAAMAEGSTFGTIAAGGSAHLMDARSRLLQAVALAQEGLDLLEAETDDQSDDVIKYDPAAMTGYDDFDDFVGATDAQRARDVLADIEGMLQGPHLVVPGVGLGMVLESLMKDLSVDLSRFFTSPVQDLKTLIPDYEISNGDFHWSALAFDEWTFPDPSFGGVLPGIGSTEELKTAIDLDGAWELFNHIIDEWVAFTQSPDDGDIFAISQGGNVFEVSADLTTGIDRPDPAPIAPVELTRNVATSELVLLLSNDELLTRPDDAASAWTQRLFLPCCFRTLAESPLGGSMFAVRSSSSLEISSDFTSTQERPAPSSSSDPASMIGNSQTGDLVVLTFFGTLFSRPPDESTPWTEHIQLPFDSFLADLYQAIAEVPDGGDMYAVTRDGAVERINSALSASGARPSVPAREVIDLIGNTQTGELLVLTPDGRIFSRPDDMDTPWTLRFTLPRTILDF